MNEVLCIVERDYVDGRYKAAIRKLREFITDNPENALGRVKIARNLLALGQYEEATVQCHHALELDQHLASAHAVLAHAYLQKQRLKESEAEAKKALEIEPDLALAYGVLGLVAISKNQLQEAIDNLRKGTSIEPDESWYHVRLGVAYQMDGRHGAAIAEYRRVFEIDQSFEAAWRIVLGYIARYRWLFNILGIVSLVVMFLVRSPFTVPIFLPWVAFVIGTALFNFRIGKRANGMVTLLLLVALAVFYVYNLLYGL